MRLAQPLTGERCALLTDPGAAPGAVNGRDGRSPTSPDLGGHSQVRVHFFTTTISPL